MSNNTSDILLEVRKAYRFLYNYQSRILDLIGFIGNKFGVNYKGGYPKFSDIVPRPGKGNLNNWAWDWLNMYFYEFHFGMHEVVYNKEGEQRIDKLTFAIFIVNDNGYFLSTDKNKIQTDTFKPVEESESKLIFVVGKNMWENWGDNWHTPDFILEPAGKRVRDENECMLFKQYNLALFGSEEDAIKCLKDFESYCLQNDINMTVKSAII
ncbi:hypothetical protein [Pseudopedobacter sp.]|uniref:hypothetical protein n=1 Tax=Pseudopedobacter sp. TaxID=1936787 RepID=UPI00333FD80A